MAKKENVVVLIPHVYNPANGVYAIKYDVSAYDAKGVFLDGAPEYEGGERCFKVPIATKEIKSIMIANIYSEEKDHYFSMGSCDGEEYKIIVGATINGELIDLQSMVADGVITDIDIHTNAYEEAAK